jgi:hypothetical protein
MQEGELDMKRSECRKLILSRDNITHTYTLQEYETGKTFTWSEGTFLKHYENGETFYQYYQCLNESEIRRLADSDTIKYDSDYGCYIGLVPAKELVKRYVQTRKMYIFFRESRYNGCAEYYVGPNQTTNVLGEAKRFDETNVYSFEAICKKNRLGFRSQLIQS